MKSKSYEAGHLASCGPLNLPKTPERNEKLSRTALKRRSISRLPKVALNWMKREAA
jgi:hypothetical protein